MRAGTRSGLGIAEDLVRDDADNSEQFRKWCGRK